MATSRTLKLLLLTALLAAPGCVDPKGEYEEFLERDEQTRGTGGETDAGESDAGPCMVPAAGELDGEYLFALSAVLKPETPLLFIATVTSQATGSDLGVTWSLQPLDRKDRMTPVGEPISVPEHVAVSDGTFDANLGTVTLSGQANPLSGSNIEAEITSVKGSYCNLDGFYCGKVDGNVTKPVGLSLSGSTWTLEKLPMPGTLPTPIKINCAGTEAGPPPTN